MLAVMLDLQSVGIQFRAERRRVAYSSDTVDADLACLLCLDVERVRISIPFDARSCDLLARIRRLDGARERHSPVTALVSAVIELDVREFLSVFTAPAGHIALCDVETPLVASLAAARLVRGACVTADRSLRLLTCHHDRYIHGPCLVREADGDLHVVRRHRSQPVIAEGWLVDVGLVPMVRGLPVGNAEREMVFIMAGRAEPDMCHVLRPQFSPDGLLGSC